MQAFTACVIALALLCASPRSSVLGSEVELGCERGELSDTAPDETVLVQTKIQRYQRHAALYHGSKLRGLARTADFVNHAYGAVKDAALSSYVGELLASVVIMSVFAFVYQQNVIEGPPPFPMVGSSIPRRQR
eukprot:CAMPEP_0115704280 /NCGR_PEP_ID=MMETSP0272-20121206/69573_1 /TAXON_ID=71861 /ORGANISM="Scrippsiella trochoidea, Strain CCMP3099" /LENGTH=132 /DNA_ID=CAMNT_0003145251 /DNA_START=80 /DNA_END=476 /DNA_ORIENTATION=+